MATVIKTSSVLAVELLDDSGVTAMTLRINNPITGLTRAIVASKFEPIFADSSNIPDMDILKSSSGRVAHSLGSIQTIESTTTTTTVELS